MCCTKSQGRRRFSSAEREAEFKQDIVACQEECSIYCGIVIARADRLLGLQNALISCRSSTGKSGVPAVPLIGLVPNILLPGSAIGRQTRRSWIRNFL